MEKTHKAVVSGIEEKQKEEEKRVDALIKEIQQEIQELKEETSQTDLRISASQSDDVKQVAVVSVYYKSSVRRMMWNGCDEIFLLTEDLGDEGLV